MSLKPGDVIANCRVIRSIGAGAMGEVYLAEHQLLGALRALKVLNPQFASSPEDARRFHEEARIVCMLDHAHIARVYDMAESGGQPVMVMEYVDGPTLDGELSQRPDHRAPWATAVEWIRQLLDGLQHAHARNVVHRDVKPANILLTSDRQVKLTDFGIATFARGDSRKATVQFRGTYEYAAPERFQGARGEAPSDLYSAGLIFYELLAGALPYDGSAPEQIIDWQFNHMLPRIAGVEGVPDGVNSVIAKATSKKPARRYQSASEMAEAVLALRQRKSSFAPQQWWRRKTQAPLPAAERGQIEALIAAGDCERARARLLELAVLHPGLPEVATLLELVKRAERVAETLREVEPLLAGQDWQKAAACLEECAAEYPDEPRLLEPLARATAGRDAELRKLRAAERADAIRSWIAKGMLGAARRTLTAAQAEFPGEPLGEAELAREEQNAARLACEIAARIEKGDLDASAAMLREGERAYPDYSAWTGLRAGWRAASDARDLEAAVAMARQLTDAGQFHEARAHIETVRARFGAQDEIDRLLRVAEAGIARERLDKDLDRLLAAARWDEAAEQIAGAEREFGCILDLSAARRRLESGRQSHQQRIAEALTKVRKCLDAGDLDAAEKALMSVPEDARSSGEAALLATEIAERRKAAEAAREANQQRIAEALTKVRKCLNAGDLDAAEKALMSVPEDARSSGEATLLGTEIAERRKTAEVARKARTQRIAEALTNVRKCLNAGDLDAAEKALVSLPEDARSGPEATPLAAEIERRRCAAAKARRTTADPPTPPQSQHRPTRIAPAVQVAKSAPPAPPARAASRRQFLSVGVGAALAAGLGIAVYVHRTSTARSGNHIEEPKKDDPSPDPPPRPPDEPPAPETRALRSVEFHNGQEEPIPVLNEPLPFDGASVSKTPDLAWMKTTVRGATLIIRFERGLLPKLQREVELKTYNVTVTATPSIPGQRPVRVPVRFVHMTPK